LKVHPRTHAITVLWTTPTGATGPPIIAGGEVWSIRRDGTLYALSKSDGSSTLALNVGAAANHFPTPGVGAGFLLAPAANYIVAFR
jgi:outer membrane protein assembly factor BamB